MQLFTIALAAWAAYTYGPYVGYRYWNAHDPFGAAFYGGGSVFMGAAIVVAYFVWPAARALWHGFFGGLSQMQLATRRKLKQQPPIPPGEIETTIRRGRVISYHGLINRDYFYNIGQESRRQRVRVIFTVQRNTGIMPRREQEAVIILETLNGEGHLPPKVADRLRYALAWNDGRCEIYHGKYETSAEMARQNGVRSFKEVVAEDAAKNAESIEGAISILYTFLQQAAEADSPGATRLMQRYHRDTAPIGIGADQWS